MFLLLLSPPTVEPSGLDYYQDSNPPLGPHGVDILYYIPNTFISFLITSNFGYTFLHFGRFVSTNYFIILGVEYSD